MLECIADSPSQLKRLFQNWDSGIPDCSNRSFPRSISLLLGIALVPFWSSFNITLDSSEPQYFQLTSFIRSSFIEQAFVGYLLFARMWSQKTKDAENEIQRINPRSVFTKRKNRHHGSDENNWRKWHWRETWVLQMMRPAGSKEERGWRGEGDSQPCSSLGHVPRRNKEHRTGALHAFQLAAGSQAVMVPEWCRLHSASAVVVLNWLSRVFVSLLFYFLTKKKK